MSLFTSSLRKIEWNKFLKKLSPYMIKKGILYLRHYGLKEFLIRLQERFEPEEIPYEAWYEAYRPTEKVLKKQKDTHFPHEPMISIVVPAYKTPELFMRQLVDSLWEQTYSNWELCIVNASPQDPDLNRVLAEVSQKDPRIRVKDLAENAGIAQNTNAGLEMAAGDYVGLLDHDDLLAPNALFEVVRMLNRHPDADAVYTDEDKVTMDLTEHFQPHFKPDYSLDLLRSNNYICHFFVVKTALAREAGGFDPAYDGAQDYDFILRCTEGGRNVYHVPEILYHWRTHRSSTADNPASKMYAFEAGRRAIEAHLKRVDCPGEVLHTPDLGFYRVKYPVQNEPLVSIIIPNKDAADILKECLDTLREKTAYKNYEILIVENNSTTKEIYQLYRELSKDPRIRFLRYKGAFNYSAINNMAARRAKGEYLLFLNNDITITQEDWLGEMLSVCQRREVGAVGAKLLYPDKTIQHAGCVIGMGGIAGAMFVGMPGERTGYLHKASILQDLSAVTAACLMTKASVFREVGGFCEELAVAFNDMDLCLKIRDKGYLIVYNPYAAATHWESKTRGEENTPEKVRRFQSEIEYMRTKHIHILKEGDPYYNKNLSLTKWNYSLRPIEGMEMTQEANK